MLSADSCSGHPSTIVGEFGLEALRSTYAVGQRECLDDFGQQLLEPLLRTAVRVEHVVKMKTGPVIGAHTGPVMLTVMS